MRISIHPPTSLGLGGLCNNPEDHEDECRFCVHCEAVQLVAGGGTRRSLPRRRKDLLEARDPCKPCGVSQAG